MNLLKDQRELFQPSVDKDVAEEVMPHGDEPLQSDIFSEHTSQESGQPEPFTPYKGKVAKKRSGMTVPVLVFAGLVTAAVVYFGLGTLRKAELKTAGPVSVESDSLKMEPPALTERPSGAAPSGVSTEKSVAVIGNIMGAILNSIPSSSRLATLFLDDGTFSVEISGPSSGLTQFQNALKAGLPPSTKISNGTVSGGKALVSGSFPRVAESGRQAIQKEQALTELSALSRSLGAQVLEKSAANDVVSGGKKRAMVYFKTSGTMDQCQNILQAFSEKDWNIEISKVILLPLNQQRANLVLRFLVISPA